MRKKRLEDENSKPGAYSFEGEDTRPLFSKLGHSLTRPIRILTQPIVLTMSTFQALIFGTTYSIYTNMQPIYGGEYGFSTEKVGLLYLGPGIGFLFAVWFLVPRIDTVYNNLTARNDGKSKPEYRLPLANIGSVFIPVALFWFAWAVQFHTHWAVSIAATFFYGVGQVMILNTVQNYYIDSFEKCESACSRRFEPLPLTLCRRCECHRSWRSLPKLDRRHSTALRTPNVRRTRLRVGHLGVRIPSHCHRAGTAHLLLLRWTSEGEVPYRPMSLLEMTLDGYPSARGKSYGLGWLSLALDRRHFAFCSAASLHYQGFSTGRTKIEKEGLEPGVSGELNCVDR